MRTNLNSHHAYIGVGLNKTALEIAELFEEASIETENIEPSFYDSM